MEAEPVQQVWSQQQLQCRGHRQLRRCNAGLGSSCADVVQGSAAAQSDVGVCSGCAGVMQGTFASAQVSVAVAQV